MSNLALKSDLKRYGKVGIGGGVRFFWRLFRYCQQAKGFSKRLILILYKLSCRKSGIDISTTAVIGEGFYIVKTEGKEQVFLSLVMRSGLESIQ